LKKQLVLACLSLAFGFSILAKKHHKFSLKKILSPSSQKTEQGLFSQLKGDEEKKARAYFDELKKERVRYYERNQNKFGEKFTLSYEITLLATRLMEKHYDGSSSFREGLKCVRQMVDHKNNPGDLKNILTSCQKKLLEFREQLENEKADYQDELSPSEFASLQNEMVESFSPNARGISYLSRAFQPNMDCYYHGGTFSLTFFFGITASAHRLKCRSKLGRKVTYDVGSGNFGMGWGAIFSIKKARFYKNEDGTYRRKTKPLSYGYFRKTRFYVSDNNAMALGFGVSHNRRDLEKTIRDSRGGGIGFSQGYGFGGMIKNKKHMKSDLKNQDHDFRELFFVLGMGFA